MSIKKGVILISALAMVFMVDQAAYSDLNDGLVAYYPFNGNANDESGNENNGNVYGATLTEDIFENANSAYSFDGVDDAIQVNPNDTLIPSHITIAAWVYLEDQISTNCCPRIVHKKKYMGFARRLRFALSNNGRGI